MVEYQACLTEEAELLQHNFPVVLLDCPGCLSYEHTSLIDSLCNQLHIMLLNCGHACIPHSQSLASKPAVTSWNTECALERAESFKWHHIWVQAGCPTGILANIMHALKSDILRQKSVFFHREMSSTIQKIVNLCENFFFFKLYLKLGYSKAGCLYAGLGLKQVKLINITNIYA